MYMQGHRWPACHHLALLYFVTPITMSENAIRISPRMRQHAMQWRIGAQVSCNWVLFRQLWRLKRPIPSRYLQRQATLRSRSSGASRRRLCRLHRGPCRPLANGLATEPQQGLP